MSTNSTTPARLISRAELPPPLGAPRRADLPPKSLEIVWSGRSCPTRRLPSRAGRSPRSSRGARRGHASKPRQAGGAARRGRRSSCCCWPSAVLVLVIAPIAGWSLLSGALPIQLAFVLDLPYSSPSTSFAGTAACCRSQPLWRSSWRSSRWSPAPRWFDRDKAGFAAPAFLNAEFLGLLTLIVIPVQMLADRVRDARFQPGLERRARAARSRAGCGHRYARSPASGLSRPA